MAGFLEGGRLRNGAKVGALASGITFAPFVVLPTVVPVATTPGAGVQLALWVSVLLILLAAVYTLGLGTVGGVLGVYVKEEV